jgi:hypothetical protein
MGVQGSFSRAKGALLQDDSSGIGLSSVAEAAVYFLRLNAALKRCSTQKAAFGMSEGMP